MRAAAEVMQAVAGPHDMLPPIDDLRDLTFKDIDHLFALMHDLFRGVARWHVHDVGGQLMAGKIRADLLIFDGRPRHGKAGTLIRAGQAVLGLGGMDEKADFDLKCDGNLRQGAQRRRGPAPLNLAQITDRHARGFAQLLQGQGQTMTLLAHTCAKRGYTVAIGSRQIHPPREQRPDLAPGAAFSSLVV